VLPLPSQDKAERMRWTKFQQILLAIIILLLAVCGARATVLAKLELWSQLGLVDGMSDDSSGDE
jgi:hypothetical protein